MKKTSLNKGFKLEPSYSMSFFNELVADINLKPIPNLYYFYENGSVGVSDEPISVTIQITEDCYPDSEYQRRLNAPQKV